MTPTDISLDALCAALQASFARANRLLADIPLPGDAMAGGPDWSDNGDGPTPWQQFYSRQRLKLESAELMLAFHVRRKAVARSAMLSTRPPAWWQRLGRAHMVLEVHLAVADGVCTLRFQPAAGQTPVATRSGAALRLKLNPQQQAQLAELRLEPLAKRRSSHWLAGLLRWLRRVTGNATK
ncbi:hypothetical protein [Rugamonas aquatica]|uniref:Uncharacterized protein n=1 Tax=Rugamonas aquatica TaxID=2743357 RepID=A0A6A7N4X6_9BURK|nr:hypothetical protein [Rugamonas aquatica]MQA39968.1 hypothetical protein [Rugamonas aquatica]